jgi:hypothetical protein
MTSEQHPPTPYQPPYPPAVAVPTSGTATASLVFGIIGILGGFCLFGIPPLLAIVCGHMGLAETKSGRKAGRGSAVAGLILGYFVMIPVIIVALLWLIGAIGAAGNS